jgi:hypothetical protein
MYTLLNNIIFYIFQSVVVYVDFLGTHMASLALFFKTRCDNTRVSIRTHMKKRLENFLASSARETRSTTERAQMRVP